MRRTFTAEEKASVFELWKNGTGFSEIANILGSKPGTIFTRAYQYGPELLTSYRESNSSAR